MSLVPPFLNNTQFRSSANLPLYSVSSDTISFSEPTLQDGKTLPPAQQQPRVLKPNTGLVQNATLVGGRNSNPPILKNYLEARNPSTGVKVYGTAAEAEQAYRNAVARFVVEKPLAVVPLNGEKHLTYTRNVVSADQVTFDAALLPLCDGGSVGFIAPPCTPAQVVPITIQDGVNPPTKIGEGIIPAVNGYGVLSGTTSLPCVIVPQTNSAYCGQTFVDNGFKNSSSEREYRSLSGILANPAMSTSSNSTNLKIQYQVSQTLAPYSQGGF